LYEGNADLIATGLALLIARVERMGKARAPADRQSPEDAPVAAFAAKPDPPVVRYFRVPAISKPLAFRLRPSVASVEVVPVMGRPDPERICTSIVERQNLSVRMGTRRFTRLTNAFSKKWENHWAAVCVWMTFYNFCRVHRSLRMTPAMAAGITGRIWNVRDLLEA
jgi:hypothetical protein